MSDPDTILAMLLAYAGKWIRIQYIETDMQSWPVTKIAFPVRPRGNTIEWLIRRGKRDIRECAKVDSIISIEEIKP